MSLTSDMSARAAAYVYDAVAQADEEEATGESESGIPRRAAEQPDASSAWSSGSVVALVVAAVFAMVALLSAATCGGAWLAYRWMQQQQPLSLAELDPSLAWFASASYTPSPPLYTLGEMQVLPRGGNQAQQPAHSISLVGPLTCRAPSFPAGRCLLCPNSSVPNIAPHDDAANMTMTHDIGGPPALLPPYLLLVHEAVGMDYHGMLFTLSGLWRLPRSCGPFSKALEFSPTFNYYTSLVAGGDPEPLPAPSHVLDHAVVLTQFKSEEYYHNLIENLPRLTLLPPALLHPDSSVPIVILAPRYDTQLELFDWLQLRHRLLLLPTIDSWVQTRQVMVVPSHGSCGSPNPRMLQAFRHMLHERSGWMADAMPDMFTAHSVTAVKRVLWIQRITGYRSVTNDAELLGDLTAALPDAELTFHRSDARLSMREVAQLYYDADLVIGPHGAGLSNLLFSRPATVVIEFLPTREHPNTCFNFLAGVLSLEHIRLMTPPMAKGDLITVPRAALAEALAYIANRSAAQRSAVQLTLAAVADNMCDG